MSMKFEVGTEVRIRTDLKIGKIYNGINFCEGMKPYLGHEAKILYCGEDFYCLDIDNGLWSWTSKMLVKISDTQTQQSELFGVGSKMYKMSTNEVVDLLLNREIEVANKFHHAISEVLRLGYDTERGEEQISKLIDSVQYSLDEIKRIVNR